MYSRRPVYLRLDMSVWIFAGRAVQDSNKEDQAQSEAEVYQVFHTRNLYHTDTVLL